MFLQQLPSTFNEDFIKNNMKKISYDLLKQKCSMKDYFVLFLLGEFNKNISDFLNENMFPNILKNEDIKEIFFSMT